MAEFVDAPEADDVPDEVAAMFDLSKQKKKKKKKKTDDGAVGGDGAVEGASSSGNDGSMTEAGNSSSSTAGVVLDAPKYTYSQMLQRIVDILHHNNPELSEKRRYKMVPPQLMRVPNSAKKTLWTNFHEICKMMHRNPEHVYQFMMAELGTEGSIDGKQNLVIKGKFVPKYIESLLRKYIMEYVQCQMCRSFNTSLTRDSASRLFFVSCQDCGSSRSVSQIRAGYHAQTRADRRAIRNNA